MALFFQFMSLLLGIVLVAVLGSKGYFLNLVIVSALSLVNKMFSQVQFLYFLFVSLALYFLTVYLDSISRKKYDPFLLGEMLLGGSAISLLAGMLLRPMFAGIVLGPVLWVPVLRRLAKLGLKALLLTIAGFSLRFLYSLILNFYIIVKLL